MQAKRRVGNSFPLPIESGQMTAGDKDGANVILTENKNEKSKKRELPGVKLIGIPSFTNVSFVFRTLRRFPLRCPENSEKACCLYSVKAHSGEKQRLCDFKYHNPLIVIIPLPGVGKAKVVIKG